MNIAAVMQDKSRDWLHFLVFRLNFKDISSRDELDKACITSVVPVEILDLVELPFGIVVVSPVLFTGLFVSSHFPGQKEFAF